MSKSIPERVITYTIWALMFIYSLSLLALYIWVLYSSFKIRMDFNENVFGFPKTFTFDNYINAISNFKVEIFRDGKLVSVYLEELLLNSFLYILGCALAATIAPAIVAYATSRFNFRFNVVLDGIVIVTMVLPIIGQDAALIQMTKTLGLYDTMIGMYFMKFMFLGFNYLLFKSSFRGVDKAYAESAQLDGASELRVMLSINFPMITNIFVIVFTIQLMGFWADWTTPLIYMPHSPTVAYALYELQFTSDPLLTFKPLQFAACILASIPTLVIFLAFRDKIMGGVAFGGLK
ncbi:MAG TPA: carbohydrate ABC transporter permease [Candidatus Borkfalkia avicola]|uniref:Carbohydrate ABC transporter permease n=1 Tax=Candidatus Borkfalkia avicola TaxID=2838503 RepID=A0A9D2D7I9_9FIRM|nr:carbohydrate ABC transporter permease [Candidatus Borkfalkia avicola]